VDISACRQRGIAVTYTPEAPSQAVAELTVGQIINLARGLLRTDRSVREGAWNRYMGQLLSDLTIGVIGVGRIGKRVIRLLQPFAPRILACDLEPDRGFADECRFEWASAQEVFAGSDVVTVHIPLNRGNRHFVNRDRIASMRTGSCLVNTSRGPVVDTEALTDAVLQNHLGGAALDVFESEPYEGPLIRCDNVILSAHIGGSTRTSRYNMELGAAEDCIRALRGEPPLNPAPDPEELE
jgi:D-3-phosphoglycerate dehydrogenase